MEEMKNEAETNSMVSMTLYAVMFPVFNEVTLPSQLKNEKTLVQKIHIFYRVLIEVDRCFSYHKIQI